MPSPDVIRHIAHDLSLPTHAVGSVLQLLDDKCTVPFIARYRKEATGGMDEVQIRAIEEHCSKLEKLNARKQSVIASINEQGKMTDALLHKLQACSTLTALEDLYLPYKQKRKTRGQMAIDRGLMPLALRILAQGTAGKPDDDARAFVAADKDVPSIEAALKGASDIVAERMAEDPDIRARVRETLVTDSLISTTFAKNADAEACRKFESYKDHSEKLATIPSHRYLAMRRGQDEGVLKVTLTVDDQRLIDRIAQHLNAKNASPYFALLREAIEDGYDRLLMPSLTTDVHHSVKTRADVEAAAIFADNLQALLLQAPLGAKPVLGIDPGIRTGCKMVFVDAAGAFVANTTMYLSQGDRGVAEAEKLLLGFVAKHQPIAIAIGNGTFGRETERFVRDVLKRAQLTQLIVVSVNEAGASVYSASDVARQEHPELDVTVRGAISIARRLQDPLAELVKIDPQSIGVGQYQHDVDPTLLEKKLEDVVESCVNRVGVELNTASPSLLARVAGIGPKLAKNIVAHREKTGGFASRKALLKVAGLGPRTFEQCAGFLRVQKSDEPLDASAVHPERYALVHRIAQDMGLPLLSLIGDKAKSIPVRQYVDDNVGLPTLNDIVTELQKPGRDPRDRFEPPRFRDDVSTMADLKPGMTLEGVVTNVTAFGAFVDVGVHQDGLVHVSQLADRFVQNAADVVKAGDRLQVRVLEVDVVRKRISLTAKQGAAPTSSTARQAPAPSTANASAPNSGPLSHNPFGQLRLRT